MYCRDQAHRLEGKKLKIQYFKIRQKKTSVGHQEQSDQHLGEVKSAQLAYSSAASDINNEGRELLKIREKINQMVSGATGQPVEKIRQDIRRDFHLTAEQALDYGVIDKVLYKRRGAGAR